MSVSKDRVKELLKFFDKTVQFRTDTDFISENLTGIYNIEYSLGAGEADGISNPEYLNKLDEFDIWFRQQKEVTHVNSFSETMKRVNKSMHGDDPDYYKVPGAKDEAAQYLLLYEMSLPYGLDLNNQINVDKSETRFTVTLKNISSNEMMALAERSENWLRDNAPEHMFSYGISTALMFSHITKNWRGRPLTSHEVIVNLVANTTTQAGLKINAALDSKKYPTGIKVSDQEMKDLNLDKNDFHGACQSHIKLVYLRIKVGS